MVDKVLLGLNLGFLVAATLLTEVMMPSTSARYRTPTANAYGRPLRREPLHIGERFPYVADVREGFREVWLVSGCKSCNLDSTDDLQGQVGSRSLVVIFGSGEADKSDYTNALRPAQVAFLPDPESDRFPSEFFPRRYTLSADRTILDVQTTYRPLRTTGGNP
ncbi:hypothetical protein BH11ARM2_BH11ARM2_17960 [soil metagenome]